jgi:SAM-dependent methyltransferase
MSPARTPYRRQFAKYYDAIYHGIVNYQGDVDFLEAVFRRFPPKPKKILDIGCGTGNHALPLARRGYRVTGIDQSREMLALARSKVAPLRTRPRFVHADMQSFELGQTFDAAVCMFGAFGYLLPKRDVLRSLQTVRAHLESRGLYVFEFWQSSAARPAPFQSWLDVRHKQLEIVRLDVSRYNPKTGRLPVEFRFVVFDGRRLIDRFTELHTIQTHSVPAIRELLHRAGFDLVEAFGGSNAKKGFAPVTPKTFRIMAVARAR